MLAVLLQLAGLAALVVAGFLHTELVGVTALGIALFAVGIGLPRRLAHANGVSAPHRTGER